MVPVWMVNNLQSVWMVICLTILVKSGISSSMQNDSAINKSLSSANELRIYIEHPNPNAQVGQVYLLDNSDGNINEAKTIVHWETATMEIDTDYPNYKEKYGKKYQGRLGLERSGVGFNIVLSPVVHRDIGMYGYKFHEVIDGNAVVKPFNITAEDIRPPVTTVGTQSTPMIIALVIVVIFAAVVVFLLVAYLKERKKAAKLQQQSRRTPLKHGCSETCRGTQPLQDPPIQDISNAGRKNIQGKDKPKTSKPMTTSSSGSGGPGNIQKQQCTEDNDEPIQKYQQEDGDYTSKPTRERIATYEEYITEHSTNTIPPRNMANNKGSEKAESSENTPVDETSQTQDDKGNSQMMSVKKNVSGHKNPDKNCDELHTDDLKADDDQLHQEDTIMPTTSDGSTEVTGLLSDSQTIDCPCSDN